MLKPMRRDVTNSQWSSFISRFTALEAKVNQIQTTVNQVNENTQPETP